MIPALTRRRASSWAPARAGTHSDASEPLQAEADRARPEVEFAELDRIVPAADVIPDDPRYPMQPEHRQIGSPAAWGITPGAQTVTIAILDTGVDGNRPDLVGHLVPGWNAYNGNSNTSDVHGHGTFMAGIAGAVGNNALGVRGTACSCKVMTIRISAPDGTGSWSAITERLVWAADHGARVANISYYSVSTSSSVTSAAQYFQNRGGVVTAAPGHTGPVESRAENP
ncbi:MAG: hypothetical protein E2O39_11870 [Planctomycetota bacterium]|nr:MAG: hypothetical protein E2O39_11870 [Planctomycetota bacterium]